MGEGQGAAQARWSGARLPAAIFVGALVVRVLYLLSVRDAAFFTHLQTEPQRYLAWATAIAAGKAPVRPPFDEAPGYPYLLALLSLPHSILLITLAQAALDAASCAAIARVAERLGGRRAGWGAGALAALYGPMIYFTGQLEPATLAVAAVSGALWLTPAGDEPASPRRWLGAGAAWAGAVLLRSELVLALPVVALHAWACGGWAAARRAVAAPAALLALSLCVNLASSGHPVVLTTGSGLNLWIGNNPQADGVSPFVHGPMLGVTREVEASTRDAVEADALFRAKALAFVRAEPERAARLLSRRMMWLWTARELPNAADVEWQTAQSWLFPLPLLPLGLGAVFPLALAGAVLLGAGWRRWLVLAAPAVVALAVAALFFTNGRFRLVVAPSLLVLGGYALDRLATLARAGRAATRPLAAAGAVAALGALLAWGDFGGVRRYRIPQIDLNTAELELTSGDTAHAIEHLRLALGADPSEVGAWIELAMVLEQTGQLDEAGSTWRRALESAPGNPELRREAGRFFQRRHGP